VASIVDLPELVGALPAAERRLFDRLFRVTVAVGRLKPPAEMEPWIVETFGALEPVLAQKVVKVTNLVTLETTLYNELRARRPMEARASADVLAEIDKTVGDPLCTPLTGTPEDIFGRVEGRFGISASNVAKYDEFSGLVVFKEHNPLAVEAEKVVDYLNVAWGWLEAAHRLEPPARFPFILWNCLWKSGASLIHGHLQMVLTRELPYGKVEALRRALADYRTRFESDLLADLYAVHEALGLSLPPRNGVRGFVYLTPLKEREVFLWADRPGGELWLGLGRLLEAYVRELGVQAFNVGLYLPPFGDRNGWEGFPALARVVDRGDPANRTADFAGMELYAASVVASDPFLVSRRLREVW